ncbi:hypothetical protein C8R45DRAFT_942762 [Mycena sanguinolenta]|nr:hypothetical protein C8R45DRAFT_942762 [Mycena sanguinolenta]
MYSHSFQFRIIFCSLLYTLDEAMAGTNGVNVGQCGMAHEVITEQTGLDRGLGQHVRGTYPQPPPPYLTAKSRSRVSAGSAEGLSRHLRELLGFAALAFHVATMAALGVTSFVQWAPIGNAKLRGN